MLSFAALSETAIAESTTTLDASAFMAGAASTASAGTINTIHLTASIETSSASSTTAAGSLQINIEEDLFSVSATTTAGTLGFDAQADTTLSAVTSTTAIATFDDVDAKATLTLPAATVTGTAGTINTIHLTANISITGVASAMAAQAPSPAVDEDLVSVSATTAVGTLSATGLANIIPPAATSVFTAGVAGFDAKANITLDAATADADLTANDFADEDAQASTTVSGVSATTTANWDTDDGIYAVQVVFAATDFERKRCVNIVPYGNYKVYVTR
jgi:hypothetical protein